MQELKQGTKLQGGKYVIKRVLGQGGFGITYLAEQVSLKREVAIKEFFMKDSCDRDDTGRVTVPTSGSKVQVERYRAKFSKEAETMAGLDHPNIVSVIDVFEENDTVYYVMPFMAGGSLSDLVKKQGRLSEKRALRYVGQVASALKYLHEQRHLCHYDVKPANILLNSYDSAVLIDFGISKNYDSEGNETSSTPVGKSAGFAPLEQYQEMVNEFSPASDVYALGATLYYLVMGKTPPTAISLSQGEELTFDNQVSQGTQRLIKDAMKLASRQRPQDAGIFIGSKSDEPASLPEETLLAKPEETVPTPAKPSKSKSQQPQEPKQYSPLVEPKKKRSNIHKVIIAAAVLSLILLPLFVFHPWKTKTEAPASSIDSLWVSPVFTAKHAFECLKNGDEQGFYDCLIEFDDELSNGITVVDGKTLSEVREEYRALFSHGIETFYIDYNSYNDYLNRSYQIIQDNGGDFALNEQNISLVVFMPDFIRGDDGYGLSVNLRFIQNSEGQWKMSIPLISHPAGDVDFAHTVIEETPEEAIEEAAKSFALNPPAVDAVKEEAPAESATEAVKEAVDDYNDFTEEKAEEYPEAAKDAAKEAVD